MRRNNLLQLLADNRASFTPIEQRIVAAAQGEATIYLYDPIVSDRVTAEWWGGVCAQDFVPAMRSIEAERIHLRINCGGGDVFAAEAICQAIRDQSAHVVAHIEGVAASAATVIACACDEVLISANSKYMIHESWTFAMGSKRDLAQVIDLLSKADQTMMAEYVRKTGASAEQVQTWCEAETWFTGQEAIDAGFADALANDVQASAQQAGPKAASRHWRLSAYGHAPKLAKPADPTEQDPPLTKPPALIDASDDHRARQLQRLQLLERTAIA